MTAASILNKTPYEIRQMAKAREISPNQLAEIMKRAENLRETSLRNQMAACTNDVDKWLELRRELNILLSRKKRKPTNTEMDKIKNISGYAYAGIKDGNVKNR